MSCETSQIEYRSSGSTTTFTFPFEYMKESDVNVMIYNPDTNAYDDKQQNDPTYGWSFANATTIKFNTAPANNTKILIIRSTSIEELSAEFFPGSAIRAKDLNSNFEQLQMSIQEDRCKLSEVWGPENTITYTEQITGSWVSDDNHVATTGAISERLDNIVSSDNPGNQSQTGKLWIDRSENRLYYWNNDITAFVQLTQQGLAGTVTVGTTTTGPPGTDAEVVNSGTDQAAILDFTIPRGDVGPEGPVGQGVLFKGTIDATVDSPPDNPNSGDLWYNSGTGVVAADWGSIAGSPINVNDRLVYNGIEWSILPVTSQPDLWSRNNEVLSPTNVNDKVTSAQTQDVDNGNILTTKQYVDNKTANSGVSSIIAGEGISVDQSTGAVTVTNTGSSDSLNFVAPLSKNPLAVVSINFLTIPFLP